MLFLLEFTQLREVFSGLTLSSVYISWKGCLCLYLVHRPLFAHHAPSPFVDLPEMTSVSLYLGFGLRMSQYFLFICRGSGHSIVFSVCVVTEVLNIKYLSLSLKFISTSCDIKSVHVSHPSCLA